MLRSRATRIAGLATVGVGAKLYWDTQNAECDSSRDLISRNSAHSGGAKTSYPLVRRSSISDNVDIRSLLKNPKPTIPGLPSREHQVQALKSGEEFDVLVIGAGATGCGVAVDAATRGLKTACVERGDFSSETSSRSSKLLWGGSKYIATAFSSLFSWKSLGQPIDAVSNWWSEMKMVWHCHQERTFMMETHPHLVNWIPIAIPFKTWIMWEPVLDHPLFMILPLIAPIFTKFYDSLSGFHCPPSFVLGPEASKEQFPQLSEAVKYCAVFYEGQHNDARTCTSIALTAALKGATIANHVEVVEILQGGPEGHTTTGVKCKDNITGDVFDVKSKAVIFAGGPFTDALRTMEDKDAKPAVAAGAGTHLVLPGYYSPQTMGLADMRTSRGAFLFFLPWLGHTIVGTTDKKCPAVTSPGVDEDEIQYLLNEVGRYLTPDLQVRRSDVLSAWRGWRPLAKDPHAADDAPVSRDHLISTHPVTGITFITGGKWTTYREMAEDTLDKVIEHKGFKDVGPCVTKTLPLIGSEGFTPNLGIKLTQKYGLNSDVAAHLVNTYGMRAYDVCELSKPTGKRWPRFGKLLVEGLPYIEGEVEYAVGEYCRNIKDFLSLRTRVAYLNSQAAIEMVPKVADIMSVALKWDKKEKERQISDAMQYLGQFGGPIPDKFGAKIRTQTHADLATLFHELDTDGSGFLDEEEFGQAAQTLGFPFKDSKELKQSFAKMDIDNNGRISEQEFQLWWNSADEKDGLWKHLHNEIKVSADWEG